MAFMINALSADLTVASCLLKVTFFLSLDIEIRFDLKFGVYKTIFEDNISFNPICYCL